MFCSGVAVLSVMSVFALLLWLPWGTLAAANCPALPSFPALRLPAATPLCLFVCLPLREDVKTMPPTYSSRRLPALPPGRRTLRSEMVMPFCHGNFFSDLGEQRRLSRR